MKITLLSKLTRKWFSNKTDWAVKDEEGDWWIARGEKTIKKEPSTLDKEFLFTPKQRFVLIIIGALLGASLAINVYYYLLCSG